MKDCSIIIIDYGMGNIRSIQNKIKRAGFNSIVSDKIDEINKANKIILPGVGHFSNGMNKLKEKNLIDILNSKVLVEKIPILGICLGIQLFTRFSEEGNVNGLGWIDAVTIKFRLSDIRYKVPHMGWNSIICKKNSQIFDGIPKDSPSFYFVHSYHLICNNKDDVLSTTEYGYEFVSAIEKDNIFGTQFHPEKSHSIGEHVLSNFLNL